MSGSGSLYGLSFVPAFLLWLFLLDENALMGGVWAVLLSLLAAWGILSLRKKLSTISYSLFTIVAILLLYLLVGPVLAHTTTAIRRYSHGCSGAQLFLSGG